MERHYDDGTEPTILPHVRCCNGPCNQGSKPCPAPDACELEEDDGSKQLHLIALAVAMVLLLVAAVLVVG